MPNKSIEKPALVLVEGLDYFHLLLNSPMAAQEWFKRNVQLLDFKEGGVTLGQFLARLREVRTFERVKSIGIICDAEDNAAAMANSVSTALNSNHFASPQHSGEIAAGPPAIGFLIVPDGAASGCLEHACLQAIAKRDVLRCAEQFLECISGASLNSNRQAKIKVHAAIAGSGHNPALTLGQSATTGLWDFGHAALSVMLRFVQRVAQAIE